jgi:acetyl esterase/lipase
VLAPAAGAAGGPYGGGASQVWVLRPHGTIRSVVVFAHGWKQAPPSPADAWVAQFRPWLDHLLAGGSAIVFPRYQLGGDATEPLVQVRAFEAGLREGFARLGNPRVPVIAAGYSFGAGLVYAYAADARAWGLPAPVAAQLIFPAGPIGAASGPPPATMRFLIQVGDRDTQAGTGVANAVWRLLAAHPAALKRYETVRSSPALIAIHSAPKRADAAAQRTFWAPLDRLLASVR